MYGICKTLVGYFSASIGMQFDVEHSFVRMILCFVFYMFHQFLYWVLQRALLDQPVVFDLEGTLILAAINSIIGVALFHFLDKLRIRE
jgi:rod shape-determining protein MreD